MRTVVSGQWSVVGSQAKGQRLKLLSLSPFAFHLLPFIVIACCLFLTSCAAPKISKPAESGYHSVLEKWTRGGKIYENFETKVLINATYKTHEFRESYAAEYISIFMLDGENKDEFMKSELEAPKKYHEFFLSIHTPNIEWSDLRKKEPIWALYLVNDSGEVVSPLEIKKVKDKGPAIIRFYPYYTEWSAGYTVKFPLILPDGREFITAEAKYIKLVLTGTPGKGELVWKLKH